MADIKKALASKLRKRAEIERESKALETDIAALETALRIMSGKRAGKRVRKTTVAAPRAAGNGSGTYRKQTAPKAILHLLKEKNIKASAPEITAFLLKNGWHTKSGKPASSIYITLARMASKKMIGRSKKGRNTVFYAKSASKGKK
ncbi:MAG: hypothetical protein IEMM0002_1517 [bacterium]|nr:MAG: hypothetical protein IEMM0002_1517 [bacterium]